MGDCSGGHLWIYSTMLAIPLSAAIFPTNCLSVALKLPERRDGVIRHQISNERITYDYVERYY